MEAKSPNTDRGIDSKYAAGDINPDGLVPDRFTFDESITLPRGTNFIYTADNGDLIRISLKESTSLFGFSIHAKNDDVIDDPYRNPDGPLAGHSGSKECRNKEDVLPAVREIYTDIFGSESPEAKFAETLSE